MHNRRSARGITEIALCAALIAVSSMISIPFPVPFTLQLLGVYFALYYLGGVRGTLAVLIYLSLGAIGLPVFAGFTGGIGRFFDATGGFIIGFLFLSIAYLLFEHTLGKSRLGAFFASLASLIVFYLSGSLWYSLVYNGGEGYFASLAVTVLPFVIPDALKILLAGVISHRLRSVFHKKSPEKQKKD